jgi:hypothetical protein
MNFDERIAQLGILETFDPGAFRADANYPQELCDFILALGLAYNDLRDLILAHILVREALPPDPKRPTPRLGEVAGIQAHLNRLMAALIHELSKLIENNAPSIEQPAFQALVRQLPRPARQAWLSLVNATQQDTATDDLSRLLLFARHKIAYHYDAREIGRGYRRAFIEDQARKPFVSRGTSMGTNRFYFADAAADTYLRTSAGKEVTQDFLAAKLDIFNDINHALRELVGLFINARGFPFRRA